MRIEAHDISKRFGGLQALDSVSVTVQSGEVTSIIGPNGAGKTTLINCLSGLIHFDSGHIEFGATVYRHLAPQQLIDIGIARTFQNIRLWENLTVREHIYLARRNFLRSKRAATANERDPHRKVQELLERLELADKHSVLPQELSYGERRRLEIARGLATEPHLLFLDEPAAGFTLSEQAKMAELIREIAASGIAIILVEHHMDLIARVSSNVVVLNFGRELMTGSITEVRQNPEVISAYLGVAT